MIRTANLQRRLASSLLSFMLFTLAGIAAAQTPANPESIVEPAVTNEAQGQDVAAAPNTAAANDEHLAIPPPLLAQTSTEPDGIVYTDFTDEAHRLRLKSRRQMGGAIGMYAGSAALVGAGIGLIISDNHEESDGIHLPINRNAGIGLVVGSVVPTLMVGLPLHRAANQHRRVARDLESGELTEFSMLSHRGANLKTAARSTFYIAGALALTSLGSSFALIGDVEFDNNRESRAAPIASFTAISAGVTAATGLALHYRGKNLERRGLEARSVQAIVTPVFYGDGAGASLYLGF